MVLAEVAQGKINLCEAQAAGPPYLPGPGYDLDRYLNTALDEATCAEQAARSEWPKGAKKKIGHVLHEFFSVWTGAEHETAVAAVHRAENLPVMITPESKLRSEALPTSWAKQTPILPPPHNRLRLREQVPTPSPRSPAPMPIAHVGTENTYDFKKRNSQELGNQMSRCLRPNGSPEDRRYSLPFTGEVV